MDRALHPEGAAQVFFTRYLEEPIPGRHVLDAHQLRSVHEYVLRQSEMRTALEQTLREFRKSWLGLTDAVATGHDVWSDSKISLLEFPARALLPADLRGELERGELSDVERESLLPLYDEPGTLWTVHIRVNVGWDQEHGVRVFIFRDGKYAGVGDM